MNIVVDGITKIYKRNPVINNVSFAVRKGDRIAVLGSNGAGKTTLLEIIATLQSTDQGKVTYFSEAKEVQQKTIRKNIGYVPQEIALFPKLTVKEQLSFWAEMSPYPVSKERVDELVQLVGLTEKVDQRIEHLSGGMKRKINIILSLLHDPELIILDEPTVGIDVQSKLEIIDFLKKISSTEKTVLFSSHDIQEIEHLCHKVIYLYEGKLLFYGTLQDAVALVKKNKDVYMEDGWKAFSFLFSHFQNSNDEWKGN